jgi:hypothetical protein
VGEKSPTKVVEEYKKSSLYQCCRTVVETTESFFASCGLGSGWGWGWYVANPDKRLKRILSISLDSEGGLLCPVLYIGCGKSLRTRVRQFMWLKHTVNHPLWALLYSGWQLELAVRLAADFQGEEKRLKWIYRDQHARKLPPLMDR